MVFNKCLRPIWSLPPNSDNGIVHYVSIWLCISVYNVCFQCFCKLYQSACSSNNLVRTVFRSASLSCRNFIGHNIMFGKSLILYEIIVVFPYIQSIWLESWETTHFLYSWPSLTQTPLIWTLTDSNMPKIIKHSWLFCYALNRNCNKIATTLLFKMYYFTNLNKLLQLLVQGYSD